MNCIHNFRILGLNEFSDHSPVYFSFSFNNPVKRDKHRYSDAHTTQDRIEYDASKTDIFRIELMNNNELLQRLTEHVNNGQVDSMVEVFSNCMYETTFKVFGKKINISENRNSRKKMEINGLTKSLYR